MNNVEYIADVDDSKFSFKETANICDTNSSFKCPTQYIESFLKVSQNYPKSFRYRSNFSSLIMLLYSKKNMVAFKSLQKKPSKKYAVYTILCVSYKLLILLKKTTTKKLGQGF